MFDLFDIQILCFIIKTFKRIDPQLRIYTYLLNELIYYSVIFIFKDCIDGLSIIFFVVFQEFWESCIEYVFKLINREAMYKQGKMCMKILTAKPVLRHIVCRRQIISQILVTKYFQVLLVGSFSFENVAFCLCQGDMRL